MTRSRDAEFQTWATQQSVHLYDDEPAKHAERSVTTKAVEISESRRDVLVQVEAPDQARVPLWWINATLTLVGLSEVACKRAKALSHGMLKRVGIAQALLGNPAVVVLDEPTAGLDPHAARGIHGLIRSIGPDQTVVVSSHNPAQVESLCEELAISDRGTLVRQDHVGRVVGIAVVLDEPGLGCTHPRAARAALYAACDHLGALASHAGPAAARL